MKKISILFIILVVLIVGCSDMPKDPPEPGKGQVDYSGKTGMAIQQVPEGYAPPQDIFNDDIDIFTLNEYMFFDDADEITLTSTVDHQGGYVYKYGYYYSVADGWVRYEFPQATVGASNWIRDNGELTFDIPTDDLEIGENYIVAYSCKKHDGQWKCGCRSENDCGYWMLNVFEYGDLPPNPPVPNSTILDLSDYPDMFIDDCNLDGILVIGDNALATDVIAVTDIAGSLQYEMADRCGLDDGDKWKIEKASNKFNLGDTVSEVWTTAVTDSEMPVLLADEKLRNDQGTEYDYEQKIMFGDDLEFEHFADNDYLDRLPSLGMDIMHNMNILNYTLDFMTNVALDSVIGSDIEILGEKYDLINSGMMDNNAFILLSNKDIKTILEEGETKTFTIDGQEYNVTVNSITDLDPKEVIFEINSEAINPLSVGDSALLSDNTYLRVVEILPDESGDVTNYIVQFYLVKDRIELIDNMPVKLNGVDQDSLSVDFHSAGEGMISAIVLEWMTDDELFLAEESWPVFPVFESFTLEYVGMTTEADEKTTLEPNGARTMELNMELKDGSVSLPIASLNSERTLFERIGGDDNDEELLVAQGDNPVVVYELDKHEYFVATSLGNKESYVMEITSLNENGADFKDVIGAYSYNDVTAGSSFNIGHVAITVNNLYLANNSVELQISDDTDLGRADRIITKAGMTIILPASCVGNSECSIILKEDIGSEGYDKETTTDGNHIKVNFGPEDAEVGVLSVNETLYEIGATDVYEGYTVSDSATKIVVDYEVDQAFAAFYYHGQESYGNFYIEKGVSMPSSVELTGGDDASENIVATVFIPTYLASDVDDPDAQNMILVGRGCDFSENCNPLIDLFYSAAVPVGNGFLKLVNNGGKAVLIVTGGEDDDTRETAKVIANYVDYDMHGTDVCVDSETLTATNGVCETVCTDSDGGEEFYIKGDILGDVPPDFIYEDRCLEGDTLRETYCDNADENTDGYMGTAQLFDCSNGCSDGACICISNDECPEGYSCNVEGKCVDGSSLCTDDDGGLNYYMKGTVDDGAHPVQNDTCFVPINYNMNEDAVYECSGSEDCGLQENYCREDGEITNMLVYCPYGCRDGACINELNEDIEGDCYDPEGYDINVKGETIYRVDGQLISQIDSCRSGSLYGHEGIMVAEYYCTQEGQKEVDFVTCENGCEDGACIQSSDPILYYKLDGNAVDSAGDNDGAVYGTTEVSGVVDAAMDFDGTNIDYIQAPLADELQITDELTVSAWVKPKDIISSDPGKGIGRVVVSTHAFNGGQGNSRGWTLGKNFGDVGWLEFSLYDANGVQSFTRYPNFFDEYLNKWAFITGTYKSGDYIRIYINGELVAEETENVANAIAYDPVYPLTLGRRADNANQGVFNGSIDELKIYNKALSSEQIEIMYDDITECTENADCPAEFECRSGECFDPIDCEPGLVYREEEIRPSIWTSWVKSKRPEACCPGDNYCVYDGECYLGGSNLWNTLPYDNIGGQAGTVFCQNALDNKGYDMWVNPDYNQPLCERTGAVWNVGTGDSHGDMYYQWYGGSADNDYITACNNARPDFIRASLSCCCGDDDIEYYKTFAAYDGPDTIVNVALDTDACCNEWDNCVDMNGNCISHHFGGQLAATQSDDWIAACGGGADGLDNNWQWLDCDFNEDRCINKCNGVAGQETAWMGAGETDVGEYDSDEDGGNGVLECCGDDADEYYIQNAQNPSIEACCKKPNNIVDSNGDCIDCDLTQIC